VGLQGTFVNLRFENFAAEIHHLKTEYPEARAIHARLVIGSSGAQQAANTSPFDLLNLATINAEMGTESAGVRQSLEAPRLQFTTTMWSPPGVLLCDAVSATLFLQDGNTSTAWSMFETLFTRLWSRDEGAIFCLERLADPETRMYDNDAQATLRCAGVYVPWVVKTKNKLSLIKALRCLGQNVIVDGDEDAAFSLFQITLEQFTAMDAHSWRADCMVRIAGILIDRSEPVHGGKLL
jgi:hypothetical protein